MPTLLAERRGNCYRLASVPQWKKQVKRAMLHLQTQLVTLQPSVKKYIAIV
jgi:hypothetical protein